MEFENNLIPLKRTILQKRERNLIEERFIFIKIN